MFGWKSKYPGISSLSIIIFQNIKEKILWTNSFLAKSLSNCVSLSLKLHNPYCHTKKWCFFQIVAAVHPGYQAEATGLPLRPLTRIVAVLAFTATKRGTPPCATRKQPPTTARPQQPHNTTTSVWPLPEVTKPCDIYAQAFQAWLVTNRPI